MRITPEGRSIAESGRIKIAYRQVGDNSPISRVSIIQEEHHNSSRWLLKRSLLRFSNNKQQRGSRIMAFQWTRIAQIKSRSRQLSNNRCPLTSLGKHSSRPRLNNSRHSNNSIVVCSKSTSWTRINSSNRLQTRHLFWRLKITSRWIKGL